MEPPHAMNPVADAWAIAAAELPLAFSQVREDPRLDVEIARRLPTRARVVMIASGGETAVCLARFPLERLVLVDVNPAQLALTRCRMHLAQTSSAAESMALLGHLPMAAEERRQRWTGDFRKAGSPQLTRSVPCHSLQSSGRIIVDATKRLSRSCAGCYNPDPTRSRISSPPPTNDLPAG